jgi:hypothetical protein
MSSTEETNDLASDATLGLSDEEREDRGWAAGVEQMKEALLGMPARQRASVLLRMPELRGDQPWPLVEVLRKLVESTKHLLVDHGCDRHGHEEARAAMTAAQEMVVAFVGHECFVCGARVPEPMVCGSAECAAEAARHAHWCPCADCLAEGPTKALAKKGDMVRINDRSSKHYGKAGLLFFAKDGRGTVSVANTREFIWCSLSELSIVVRKDEDVPDQGCRGR